MQTNATRLWRYLAGYDLPEGRAVAARVRVFGSDEGYRQSFSSVECGTDGGDADAAAARPHAGAGRDRRCDGAPGPGGVGVGGGLSGYSCGGSRDADCRWAAVGDCGCDRAAAFCGRVWGAAGAVQGLVGGGERAGRPGVEPGHYAGYEWRAGQAAGSHGDCAESAGRGGAEFWVGAGACLGFSGVSHADDERALPDGAGGAADDAGESGAEFGAGDRGGGRGAGGCKKKSSCRRPTSGRRSIGRCRRCWFRRRGRR